MQMGSLLKHRYNRFKMDTRDSCVENIIKDHNIGDKDSDTNLNDEKCFPDEVDGDKELKTTWKIPKKPRTPRIVVGELTYVREEDVEHFINIEIINEKNPRESKKCSRDDDFGEESFRKKRPKKVEAVTFRRKQPPNTISTPELTQNLQDCIRRLNLEAPPLFVAQKALYVTDIRPDQGRLSLPKSLINPDFFDKFMTDNEKEMLKEKEHVEVSLVDNKLHEYKTLNLVKWNMNSSSIYVLTTGWNDVVKDNKLEEVVLEDNKLDDVILPKNAKEKTIVVMEKDDKLMSGVVVQVWCFRKEARLWFALNIQGKTEHNVIGKTKGGHKIITKLLSN